MTTHDIIDPLSAHAYPRDVAREVQSRRPEFAAGNAISAVLTEDPSLTADQAIAILDQATEDHAAENTVASESEDALDETDATWRSGPLPFRIAAQAWAAAAGINGAFVPDEFYGVVQYIRPDPTESATDLLESCLAEANRRADWFQARVNPGGMGLARAEVVYARLEWVTSVTTVLYRVDPVPCTPDTFASDRWEVAIEGGRHVTRQEAAEQVISRGSSPAGDYRQSDQRQFAPLSAAEQPVPCACGEWSGERCQWQGPCAETVVIEFMPAHLRESHRAAGNSGTWPHNGAVRIRVHRDCAASMVETDGEWCEVRS